MHWQDGSGYLTLEMTKDQAARASHSGQCDQDVSELMTHPKIKRQLAQLDPADVRKVLSEYGCWDESELADHDANLKRITWLAACDIRSGNC